MNHADNFQMTALLWAVSLGLSVDVAALLVESGARVDARDVHGRTPLIVAVVQSGLPMVRYLLEEAEADIEAQDVRVSHLQGSWAWPQWQLVLGPPLLGRSRRTRRFSELPPIGGSLVLHRA